MTLTLELRTLEASYAAMIRALPKQYDGGVGSRNASERTHGASAAMLAGVAPCPSDFIADPSRASILWPASKSEAA